MSYDSSARKVFCLFNYGYVMVSESNGMKG